MRIPHVTRPKKPMNRTSARHVGLKALVGAAFGVMLFSGAALAADLPSYKQVRQEWRSSESWLLDRNGRELQRVRLDNTVRRFEWTAVADISPALKDALLASEDQRFFEHEGVDWIAAMNAAVGNVANRNMRGASTLTMQLAGLIDPELKRAEGGRSFAQKVQQARAALTLEKTWKKSEILEAYLNLVAFRGELQGVSAMSYGLFGKAPHGLDRREAAIAATLIRAPNADAKRVADRACWLLTQQDSMGGKRPASAASCDGLPGEVKSILARGYERFPSTDAAPHAARKLLTRAGERVPSSLDATVQAVARRALRTRLGELAGRNVEDGAVVVLDNTSGEVLAYVGSSGDLSQAAAVDGAVALRQAGSTLKPFLYALAIEEQRLTAASILDDSPVQLKTDNGLYIPRNYAATFRGPVSVRASLAGSLNIPAVRTLVMVGTDRFTERLRAVGLESVKESGDYYGFSLALGSADVTLLSLTNAYRVLANGGQWSAPVLTRQGHAGAPRRVMSAAASHVVSDILADQAARGVAFGMGNALDTPFWTAVKTGTSKDMRDNWTIGYSSRYTVGVWVGNASGSPMHDVSGVSGAAPVWRDVMLHLHKRIRSEPPAIPAGVVTQEIRYEPAIEPARREVFVAGSEREVIRSAALGPAGNAQARIVAPVPGSVIALDPDIPPANQRLQLRATTKSAGIWELNGKTVGHSARPVSLFPMPGTHRLRLVSASGEVLDEAVFEVRGAQIRSPGLATATR